MNKFYNWVIVLTLLIFITSCATVNVVHITKNTVPTKKQGFYYYLPQTELSIDITVTENKIIHGPYAQFAEKFLGLRNASLTDKTNYELNKFSITTVAKPDSATIYLVTKPLGACQKHYNILASDFAESGVISSINSNTFTNSKKNYHNKYRHKDKFDNEAFKFGLTLNVKEELDTVTERTAIDSFQTEVKQIIRKKLVERPDEEKAKEVSEMIFQIRKKKLSLISGELETPYPENTLNQMIDELDKSEQKFMDMFTGIIVSSTSTYHYSYLPLLKNENKNIPLFKFSPIKGIMTIEDESVGDFIFIHFVSAKNTQDLSEFIKQKENLFPQKKHGFYYRIAEPATFSIKQGETVKEETTLLIPQFGVVSSMPVSKHRTQIQFFPNTGAIKELSY